jgi:hypothetical protein
MKKALACYSAISATPFFIFSAYLITNAADSREASVGVLCGFAGIALVSFSARLIYQLSR